MATVKPKSRAFFQLWVETDINVVSENWNSILGLGRLSYFACGSCQWRLLHHNIMQKHNMPESREREFCSEWVSAIKILSCSFFIPVGCRTLKFTRTSNWKVSKVAGQTLNCYCKCCGLLSASIADALWCVNMVCLPLTAERNAHEICLTQECLQIVRHLLWKQTKNSHHTQ